MANVDVYRINDGCLTKLIEKFEEIDKLNANEDKLEADDNDIEMPGKLIVNIKSLALRIFGEHSYFLRDLNDLISYLRPNFASGLISFGILNNRCRVIKSDNLCLFYKLTQEGEELLSSRIEKLNPVKKNFLGEFDEAHVKDICSLLIKQGKIQETYQFLGNPKVDFYARTRICVEIAETYMDQENFIDAASALHRIQEQYSGVLAFQQMGFNTLYLKYSKKYGKDSHTMLNCFQMIINQCKDPNKGVLWMRAPQAIHWQTPKAVARLLYHPKGSKDQITAALRDAAFDNLQEIIKAVSPARSIRVMAMQEVKERRMRFISENTPLIRDVTTILAGYDEPSSEEILKECLELEAEETQSEAYGEKPSLIGK